MGSFKQRLLEWRISRGRTGTLDPYGHDLVYEYSRSAWRIAGGSARGTFYKRLPTRPGLLLAAIIAGLLMGYGARLSYGCNISAFFSGVTSSALHGWVWIIYALPGNALGIAARRRFGLTS